jgi:hypothetical protein
MEIRSALNSLCDDQRRNGTRRAGVTNLERGDDGIIQIAVSIDRGRHLARCWVAADRRYRNAQRTERDRRPIQRCLTDAFRLKQANNGYGSERHCKGDD